MRTAILLICLALLTGCAFHKTPYVTYKESVPLSETSVFAAFDNRATRTNDSRITLVNGQKLSCMQAAGCPYWVRVLPGKNTFLVHYTADFQLVSQGVSHNYKDFAVEIPDMRPRHVYVARYIDTPDGDVRIEIEDLGENPDFGIRLGLGGSNDEVHRVKF